VPVHVPVPPLVTSSPTYCARRVMPGMGALVGMP
jgi:hypothetical protein